MNEEYTIEMLPKRYQKDIKKAINILTGEGCQGHHLWYSLGNGFRAWRVYITGFSEKEWIRRYVCIAIFQ